MKTNDWSMIAFAAALRWQRSIVFHLGFSISVLALTALLGEWISNSHGAVLTALLAEQDQVLRQVRLSQPMHSGAITTDFDQLLAPTSTSDAVFRDIGRFAQSTGVQIVSLSVQAHPRTERSLGQIQYALSTSGPYRSTKAWMAELLARYPSLSVQGFSMRPASTDSTRQEVQLSFMQFVKD